MKTSNKLLLGILLIMLILVSAAQLMVYAKYKKGDYVKFQREKFSPMTSLNIPAVKYISVKGLGSCSVKPADVLKLEIQKDQVGHIKYNVVNDTLIINGLPLETDHQIEQGSRNRSLVNIQLPASVQLKGVQSSFRVWGADDSTAAPSFAISLEKNSYLFINFSGADKASVYFSQLNIHGEGATIDLNDHVVINDLNVHLANSKLNDNAATIRKLTMEADNNSSISLSGKNLQALK